MATAVSFTPVKASDEVINLFLSALDTQGLDESWFADDCRSPLLADRKRLPIDPALPSGSYQDHRWTWPAIARVAGMKNDAILRFLESDFDFLFLIDADVLVPPGFVSHLLEFEMPVVSGVYWTAWPNGSVGPNVWDYHPYTIKDRARFDKRGHHVVGGLGACTLIRRDVLEAGANFTPVKGLADGEDRQFCIRASVLGFPLTACTHFDLFHIYRDSDLPKAKEWADAHLRQLSGRG